MLINSRLEDGVAVLELEGRMDATAVAPIKEIVTSILDSGTNKFLFDMKEVSFVDSSGLGTLVSLLRLVNQQDGDIRLCNTQPRVKALLEMTRMDRMLEILPNAEEALQNY